MRGGLILIDINGLCLAFGERVIFSGVNCRIADDDRLALVGNNGAGKTTLLRVLTGQTEPDSGRVEMSKGLTIGYLPQDLVELEPVPVMELLKERAGIARLERRLRETEARLEMTNQTSDELQALLEEHARTERQFEHLGGFSFEASARKVLYGLGFSAGRAGSSGLKRAGGDDEKNCAEFSGGWKMRIAMAALLVSAPDVLLLDEPTNHLDTESMEWLEGWLRAYKGAVVAVSHDRRFLENTASRIADLDGGTLTIYPCGYDRYLVEKRLRREQLERSAEEQRREIERIEQFAERFRYKATKAAQVQSRLKRLEKMEIIKLPNGGGREWAFRIPEAPQSGHVVLRAEGLSKHYGDLDVFDNVSFSLERGERTALVGVNGAGKSTLLRLLSGTEEPTDGVVKLGHNVKMAFYSQESAQNVTYSRTVWEEARAAPSKLNDVERRSLLGAFMFSGNDINKGVSVLSGGEKARLALFKLMLAETNFLVLDEPTNHLDQTTREIVQQALLQYQGTLLIVSHDRSFLDVLAERVLEIRGGSVRDYPGNYSWFLEKREETLAREAADSRHSRSLTDAKNSAGLKTAGSEAGGSYREDADRRSREGRKAAATERENAAREARRIKAKLKPLEARIEALEGRVSEIDTALCDPTVLQNSKRVQELMTERSAAAGELEGAYAEWENLMRNSELLTGIRN